MDQTSIKLCNIATCNNKELRKTQISWTLYHHKVAQDMCDPVHSQPEKDHMDFKVHMALQ